MAHGQQQVAAVQPVALAPKMPVRFITRARPDEGHGCGIAGGWCAAMSAAPPPIEVTADDGGHERSAILIEIRVGLIEDPQRVSPRA